MSIDLEPLLGLGLHEKLKLVEDLWDRIASDPRAVAVADRQKELLAGRKAEYLRDPQVAVPWEEARARILGNGRD